MYWKQQHAADISNRPSAPDVTADQNQRGHNPTTTRSASTLTMIGLSVLLAMLSVATVHAQRWQYDYGGTCSDRGYKGVQPVAANALLGLPAGYIAVGQSNSPTLCTTTDIYVVRTDLNGALVWSATFNIGGNDVAYDVQECASAPIGAPGSPAPAVGDLIITGRTDGPTCVGSTNDLFLLRISADGLVVKWVQTYGTATGSESGFDLVETTTGGALGTAVGDIAVAGIYIPPGGSLLNSDAYLLRVNGGTGALIWDMTYGGLNGEEFRGVAEATVGLAPGATGDILAVGRTSSFTPPWDILAVRVNGANGAIGLPPQNGMVYGHATRQERGTSIQELTIGAEAGNIIISGATRGAPTGSPSTNWEALLLKTGPDPCNIVLGEIYGDNGPADDGATDVHEILSLGAGLNQGNLIVTGYTNVTATVPGFGTNDVFLMEVAPATLIPAGLGFALYGGANSDFGESVAEVPGGFGGAATAGFVICGFEQSNLFGGGDPEQMYLIKTDALGSSNCNVDFPTVVSQLVNFPKTCGNVALVPIGAACVPLLVQTAQTWGNLLCYSNPKRTIDPTDGSSISLTAHQTNSLYPNPVRRGDIATMRYEGGTEKSGTELSIRVVNSLGEVIARFSRPITDGTISIPLSTTGWATGIYLITAECGNEVRTARMVVNE